MPRRNRVKVYISDSYYHIYNCGISKDVVFKDKQDYRVFLDLLKKYLSDKTQKDKNGREQKTLYGSAELLAYCLMPNLYHLLIYQNDSEALPKLMQKLNTSYSLYFNKRYKVQGSLFEDRYRATIISGERDLKNVSRYIHLVPARYRTWKFSSLPYYIGNKKESWIMPGKVTKYSSPDNNYSEFLENRKDYKNELDNLQNQLANQD